MTHFKVFHRSAVNLGGFFFVCLFDCDKIDLLFKNYKHSH